MQDRKSSIKNSPFKKRNFKISDTTAKKIE